MPVSKTAGPFYAWSIDTIVGLPPTKHGDKDLVVCVCEFSKWVEVGIVRGTLDSLWVTKWFHLNITCRYGAPARVRTDRGREYLGNFRIYCE